MAGQGRSLLTPRAALDLLEHFDVADDPLAKAFLADILASDAAPRREIELLRQLSVLPVGCESAPAENGKTDKKESRKRQERASKPEEVQVSPFFDIDNEAEVNEKGHDNVTQSSDKSITSGAQASTRLVAVFTTTAILNAQPLSARPPETPPSHKTSFEEASSTSGRRAGPRDQKRELTSPFFTSREVDEKKPPKTPRTPKRAVSGLPFAPLTAARFGLIQEDLADDLFWLLVALVFLVRVAGRTSLPVFWAVKAAYPTADALADASPRALVTLLHPLGMSSVRCATIQRYARQWLEQPPRPGICSTVRRYPQLPEAEAESKARKGCTIAGDSQWEIGHLTQGAYTVDSWRIFCRDVLLGRSDSWQGRAGRCHSFQPEWMRVLPRDKELRACLRWMWMKEGWDWDPRTGNRTVL
ncbi:pre-mRNA splicing factor [Grosmannia clavigera kw1407]|uniref:Pre-mRNA splicing factor n=1 Tax=Grosmannia clavigera (strain kw1407 / UAMH 11150) TaxID=655863 RepID=F0X944_GROCL|nr:pre-mRNA splicing factor [Grosmannia clavigera kw1407]EFX05821.1 pre-mRNA splicing factor [Grosmannia clavigera kw1407]